LATVYLLMIQCVSELNPPFVGTYNNHVPVVIALLTISDARLVVSCVNLPLGHVEDMSKVRLDHTTIHLPSLASISFLQGRTDPDRCQ